MLPVACGLGAAVAGPLLHRTAGWATGSRTQPAETSTDTTESGAVRVVSAAAVTVVGAAAAVVVAVAVGPSWLLPAHLWLLAMAVVLTVTDVTHRRLPNVVVLPGGAVLAVLLSVGAVAAGRAEDLRGAAAGAALLFGVFLLGAVLAPAGMGMGDVKLVAVLGLMLGFTGGEQTVLAVLVAAVLHVVVAGVLAVRGGLGRRTALPFGPPLLAGTAVAIGWFAPLFAGLTAP